MKIELWSDYACPYCYIGEKRLEKAIESLNEKDDIEVVFRAFELDPEASRETTSTTKARIEKKYRISEEKAQDMIDNITEMAAAEGLEYNYGTTLYTNTFDAHRVTKYAQTKGKKEIIEKLFAAYFTDNLQLSSHDLLIDIAEEAGLDREEVKRVLDSGEFSEEVRADEREAYLMGANAVPFFLINEKYTIAGAQSTELIKEALVKVLAEERRNKLISIDNLEGMVCGIDGCHMSEE